MKKYTTLEAIEKLKNSTDGNLRFDGKGYNGENIYIKKMERLGQDCIMVICEEERSNEPFELNTFTLSIGWTLSDGSKEVDVITAMKEHFNGKDIYCIIDDSKVDYRRLDDCRLEEEDGTPLGSLEIIKGRWFVRGE